MGKHKKRMKKTGGKNLSGAVQEYKLAHVQTKANIARFKSAIKQHTAKQRSFSPRRAH